MAFGFIRVLPASQHTELNLSGSGGGTDYPSIKVLNPNDGVVYIARNHDCSSINLGDWDWKVPSQSYAALPGPFTSVGMFYLDQSGAGRQGEITVYPSQQKLDDPLFISIGRALQAQASTLDITEGTLPASPGAGILRLWGNVANDTLHILNSGGLDDLILSQSFATVVLNKTFDGTSNVLSLISSQTLVANAATLSFANIPNNYDSLVLLYKARSTATGSGGLDGLRYQANSVASASYYSERILAQAAAIAALETGASTSASVGLLANADASASLYGVGMVVFPGYCNAPGNQERSSFSVYFSLTNFLSGGLALGMLGNHIDITQAINRLDLFMTTGQIAAGSTFQLYGL